MKKKHQQQNPCDDCIVTDFCKHKDSFVPGCPKDPNEEDYTEALKRQVYEINEESL